MAGIYNYSVKQRVRIKASDGGKYRPPPDSAKGALGTIAPQLAADWSGTRLALEADALYTYYVTMDDGTTELICEDWLEPAPNAPAPPNERI